MSFLEARAEERWRSTTFGPSRYYIATVYGAPARRKPLSLAAFCEHKHRTEAAARSCAKRLAKRVARPIAYPAR